MKTLEEIKQYIVALEDVLEEMSCSQSSYKELRDFHINLSDAIYHLRQYVIVKYRFNWLEPNGDVD